MKKIIASTLVAAAALVGFAGGASAHTPKVSHDCTEKGATLTVHLVQYEKGSSVLVNGVKSVFGQAEYKTTTTIGDGTKPVTWTVRVTNGAEYTPKTDKYDQEFSDTVAQCVTPPLEDKDLTPVTTTVVTYPATPICMVPGLYLLDASDPKCVDVPVVMAPPMVLERAPVDPPVALAFTGLAAYQLVIFAALFIGAGVVTLKTARAINKDKG